MADPKPFRSIGEVPLVGQAVNVLTIHPVVVAQCNCGKPGAQVFTIFSPAEHVRCQGCGQQYMLTQFEVTNQNGAIGGSCVVSKVFPRPSA